MFGLLDNYIVCFEPHATPRFWTLIFLARIVVDSNKASLVYNPEGAGLSVVVLVLDGTAPRSSGRQKTRTSVVRRASTAVRLPPLTGRSSTSVFFLFFFL